MFSSRVCQLGFAFSLLFTLESFGLSCFEWYSLLQYKKIGGQSLEVPAYGTERPLARAFEKEGRAYSDIADWFDALDSTTTRAVLRARLKSELEGTSSGSLTRWLRQFAAHYQVDSKVPPARWESLTPIQQLNYVLEGKNALERVNTKGREELFWEELLTFDLLRPSAQAPNHLEITDDEGSYEIRSRSGETDRGAFQQKRSEVEEYLEGPIGHQHLVHAWPEDPGKRQEIAPYYIELLDSTSWYLFFRQLKRSPYEVTSILGHRFLGVYTRPMLNRLYEAVAAGDVEGFKNKYRMVGARALKANPEIKGQEGLERIADFEVRSGNKGERQDFVEDTLEARLASGDYSGLADYRSYAFEPTAPLSTLLEEILSRQDIAVLEQFESTFPGLKLSTHALAYNHLRTKVLSPLFPWENRIPLEHKMEVLVRARLRYAKGLVEIAREYLKEIQKRRGPPEKGQLTSETFEKIECLAYLFAKRVRLETDFERYLTPRPTWLPQMTLERVGPLDVNEIDLGIEYSFRFPDRVFTYQGAEAAIQQTAEAIRQVNGGGAIEKLGDGGHGHGLSVRFRYTDPKGRLWRIEWDGVQRTYQEGFPVRPRGGHIEIPTPKFSPKSPEEISWLFKVLRGIGRDPKRSAGGAHVNIDLAPLKALEPRIGARKLANLIAFFESNREMVSFLWQHPFRQRVAIPIEISRELIESLDSFSGDWRALGRLLYQNRYFNPYVGRKPAYVQLNVTGVMDAILPEAYRKTLDIKNPTVPWFPAFGGKGTDRIEFRLFDAPLDEYMAALQIKYVRALLNRSYNVEGVIRLQPRYSAEMRQQWLDDPSQFLKEAEAHLVELGLDPVEFRPLLSQAQSIQIAEPSSKPPLRKFNKFLPPRR